MNNIRDAFNTLANIAGGIIENNKFIKKEHTVVNKFRLEHEEKKFFCLTVPSSAFLIKSDDQISITGNCHSLASAWAFKELKRQSELSIEEEEVLRLTVIDTGNKIREHEHQIVNMIFEQGSMDGITATQMHHFVDSRINVCLEQLGYEKEYEVTYNPVGNWFYQGLNNYQFNDFFSGIGSNYNRNWNEDDFKYKGYTE